MLFRIFCYNNLNKSKSVFTGVSRTDKEAREKWVKLQSEKISRRDARKKTGNNPVKIVEFDEYVLDIIGDESPLVAGVQGRPNFPSVFLYLGVCVLFNFPFCAIKYGSSSFILFSPQMTNLGLKLYV